jgi:hypothetical protein
VLWFNQECFDELLGWLMRTAVVDIAVDPDADVSADLEAAHQVIEQLRQAEAASGYRVDRLLEAMTPGETD